MTKGIPLRGYKVFKPKTCARCGEAFVPRSSKSKFCNACKPIATREYRKEWWAHAPHGYRHDYNCRYLKQYHMEHREEQNKKRVQYSRDNPEIQKAIKHRYRARKKGNGGSHTPDELHTLFEQQEGLCFYCGGLLYASFDRYIHIDHKIPISRGGTNNIENIALSCASCNLKKNTKTADEFMRINGTKAKVDNSL